MGVYDQQIATALRLLKAKGETSTIERGSKVAGAQSWKPGTATTDHAATAAWFNFNLDRVDGEKIKAGDQRVIVAASGLAITPDASTDQIVRAGGSRWSIMAVETLSPNGEEIIHTLQVRG